MQRTRIHPRLELYCRSLWILDVQNPPHNCLCHSSRIIHRKENWISRNSYKRKFSISLNLFSLVLLNRVPHCKSECNFLFKWLNLKKKYLHLRLTRNVESFSLILFVLVTFTWISNSLTLQDFDNSNFFDVSQIFVYPGSIVFCH